MKKMPLSGFLIAGGILAALYLYRASKGKPGGLLPAVSTVVGPSPADIAYERSLPGVQTSPLLSVPVWTNPNPTTPLPQLVPMPVPPAPVGQPSILGPTGADPFSAWAGAHPDFFKSWKGAR